MNEEASRKVIDIAKEFIDFLLDSNYSWKKAFYRYYEDDQMLKSTGSYIQGNEVELISPVDASDFFRSMNNLFSELRELVDNKGDKFLVALLIVDKDYNYDIKFEYDDPDLWEITKLNGASGIPAGYSE